MKAILKLYIRGIACVTHEIDIPEPKRRFAERVELRKLFVDTEAKKMVIQYSRQISNAKNDFFIVAELEAHRTNKMIKLLR